MYNFRTLTWMAALLTALLLAGCSQNKQSTAEAFDREFPLPRHGEWYVVGAAGNPASTCSIHLVRRQTPGAPSDGATVWRANLIPTSSMVAKTLYGIWLEGCAEKKAAVVTFTALPSAQIDPVTNVPVQMTAKLADEPFEDRRGIVH